MLLICDEPTSALDPMGRREILELLRSVREETTVLFSTHILSDVERICSDVALLNDGKTVISGPMEEIRRMHSAETFWLELCDPSALSRVREAFPEAVEDDGKLRFAGDDGKMHDVMRYLTEARIAVRRIEREEPTLERLFMEAVIE